MLRPPTISTTTPMTSGGGINGVQNGDTYVLRITTTVPLPWRAVDVTYMPYIGIGNQHMVANSGTPVSGSTLPYTAGPGSWTWTADGDYLWNWEEVATKIVHLNSYVSGGNVVKANFSTSQQYWTDADAVANEELQGSTGVSTGINNPDDSTGGSIAGTSSELGPTLDLTTSTPAADFQPDHSTGGSVGGTTFSWGLPPIGENQGWGGLFANLDDSVSFTPGFSVTRVPDITVFDFAGGTQVIDLTVIAEEDMERLNLNGNVRPGGYDSTRRNW